MVRPHAVARLLTVLTVAAVTSVPAQPASAAGTFTFEGTAWLTAFPCGANDVCGGQLAADGFGVSTSGGVVTRMEAWYQFVRNCVADQPVSGAAHGTMKIGDEFKSFYADWVGLEVTFTGEVTGSAQIVPYGAGSCLAYTPWSVRLAGTVSYP